MAQTQITITHDKDVANDLKVKYQTQAANAEVEASLIENLMAALGTGVRNGSMVVNIGDGTAAQASGTITYSAPTVAGDTIIINGVTLTAVASGATGLQYNVGATATIQAANLVNAINNGVSALISSTVVATSALGVVTLTAVQAGIVGNAITTAKGVDTGAVVTVSGARLTSGADLTNQTAVTYKYGV
jgi:diphthamide biosynthesis methyltransferase